MERPPHHEGGEHHSDKHGFQPNERIELGIAAAMKDEVVIDDHTARAIAAELGSIETPMLDLFAHTGHFEQDTFAELGQLRLASKASPHHDRWIDWLGGYWLDRRRRQADAERPEQKARSPTYEPRVYTVDLASFERNIDHGMWLDASQATADLKADIAALLDSSPIPGADRWAVGAAKGFGKIDPVGIGDLGLVSGLAHGLLNHGAAYSAWVHLHGTDDVDKLNKFSDFYIATYNTAEDWLHEITDDLRWRDHLDRTVDPTIRPYVSIDRKKMFEEAMHRWDVVRGEDGRIYVFLR